jgi:hypothetical protein
MGSRRLGEGLSIIGAVLLAIAYSWWREFYGAVQNFFGNKGDPPLECLYAISGPCRAVANVAALAGAKAYDPLIFWAGAILIGLGLLLYLGGSAPDRASKAEKRANDRIEPRF